MRLREPYKPLDRRTVVRNKHLHAQRKCLDAERGCRAIRQWGVRSYRDAGRCVIGAVEALECAHLYISLNETAG